MKNRTTLRNKTLLLGVCGGVAAYKSIELVRRLKDEGASVVVMMTDAARRFVTPLSLEVASSHKVHTSLFDEPLVHIAAPAAADLMLVAPATADIIGKFANGIADDLLSTCFLSYKGKVVIAPAMNWRMYEHPAVRANLARLASYGAIQIGPNRGDLACGEEGVGRMAEIPEIIDAAKTIFSKKDLANEKVVVTAGPTREYIDPVRFISNRSSGKMGYALVRAARDRGAEVTLITGPTGLHRPSGAKVVQVETSAEMLAAVAEETARGATLLIMAAAVADFSPVTRSDTKIDKTADMRLQLRPTDDIVSAVALLKRRPFIIGFAAETGDHVARAAAKMRRKKMDMIVFNNVLEPGSGFETDTNRVVIIDKSGRRKALKLMSKDEAAGGILDAFVAARA